MRTNKLLSIDCRLIMRGSLVAKNLACLNLSDVIPHGQRGRSGPASPWIGRLFGMHIIVTGSGDPADAN